MFPHTVTVWSRSHEETYTRTVVIGVLWEDNRGVQIRKTGASSDNGILVTIPLESAPAEFKIRCQDFMALGDVSVIPRSSKDLIAVGALVVTAADRLDFGGLPHWEVTCK